MSNDPYGVGFARGWPANPAGLPVIPLGRQYQLACTNMKDVPPGVLLKPMVSLVPMSAVV